MKTNSKCFSSKFEYGIVQYKLGDKEAAISTHSEATNLNPASVNSFFWLGKIYREIKKYDQAETNLKEAEKLSDNALPEIQWELALFYYYNFNRFAEAALEL